MADTAKQILAKPIHYADEVIKTAGKARSFRQDCLEIKAKSEKLAGLLRQAARASGGLYERPARRISDETERALRKALTLVFKCRANGLCWSFFTIIPAAAFRKISKQLENSIRNVSWLLRVLTPADYLEDKYFSGIPPITANEPTLCLIWEQIAILCSGSIEDRIGAAASFVSMARANDRYRSLIIEEGGVPPLLKLANEERMEGQENAARAIALLGVDPESIQHIVNAGVSQVFAKILKEGHMKVRTVVAWAVSEWAARHPMCQDSFAQSNTIRLLVSHLACETIQEHGKYVLPIKQSLSDHSLVINSCINENANGENGSIKRNDDNSQILHPMENQTTSQMQNVVANTMAARLQPHDALTGSSVKRGEFKDPATKEEIKSLAARALRYLCAGNITVCRSITESGALPCFAVLLEKGPDEVKYHSAVALSEITAVAEQNAEFRGLAFEPTSPAAKAVVDQFLGIIQKADSRLLIPSIRSIGNLASTFRTTQTRFINPLVNLLDKREPEITSEAAAALSKFAGPDNFLHEKHCKAIISAGGTKHLITLVYFGELMVQVPCLKLLCYIATHVPASETLLEDDVQILLEWAAKQPYLVRENNIESLVYEAKELLELYLSGGTERTPLM